MQEIVHGLKPGPVWGRIIRSPSGARLRVDGLAEGMKLRHLFAALVFPLAVIAAPPAQVIVVDIQKPVAPFSLRAAAGTAPLIRAQVKDGGSWFNATAWTGVLFWATSQNSTQAVAISSTGSGTNYVEFQVPANKLASTGGTMFAQLVLSDGANAVEWARGKWYIDASPGTYGAAITNFGPILNWDLIGTYLGTPPWTLETNGLTAAQAGQIATNVITPINAGLTAVGSLASNALPKSGGAVSGVVTAQAFTVSNAGTNGRITFARGAIYSSLEGIQFSGSNVSFDADTTLNINDQIQFTTSPTLFNFGTFPALKLYDDQATELTLGLFTSNSVTAASLVGNGAGVTNVDAVSLRGISGTNYLRGVVFAGTTNRPNSSGLAVVGGVLSIAAYQADITNNVRIVVTNSPTVGVLNILKTMGDGTAWWGAP